MAKAKAKVSTQTGGIDVDKARSYIDRVEEVKTEMRSEQSEYMARAKELRGEIKEIYKDAKDDGLPVAALKASSQILDLQRRKDKIEGGLDLDVSAAFLQVMESFDETPLGQFASGNGAAQSNVVAGPGASAPPN